MTRTSQRRRLIPKHRTNVRVLPLQIWMWKRDGHAEKAARGQQIYNASVAALRALGETVAVESRRG